MNEQFQENMDQLLCLITSKPDTKAIMGSLLWAALLAALMWGTYRLANKGKGYRPQFGVTLISLALISTVLMDLIQSNLALSLGMLGSLSIVRFRTNIRDPRDIGFIFWSMAIGIAAATGSYFIGGTGSLFLAGIMLCTRKSAVNDQPMLLVVRGSSTDIDEIQDVVNQLAGTSAVKAKNILTDSFELVYEVSIARTEENRMIDRLFGLEGIDSVNLLACNA